MTENRKKIRLGIGLATGRKSFKRVLYSYTNIWKETLKILQKDMDVSLNLFVSYDVDYNNTKSTDFTNLNQEIVDTFEQIVFMGAKNAYRSFQELAAEEDFSTSELKSVFGAGYAGKRNAVLFSAIEQRMDYLIFLDDDEYPMAVTKRDDLCLWSGQRVFLSHIKNLLKADITNGYHCGYISPIPQIAFNDILTEEKFHIFIRAISNDVISWESILELMKTGGVTYASPQILSRGISREVPWENNCRFITGANLGLNLTDPSRTLPFFNPPGARGEDTFLSTLLEHRKVLRIPCYTFHDGFSYYHHLLDGVLPSKLKSITADSPRIVTRFVNACIGWVRYKPLFVYITDRENYESKMQEIRENLEVTIPAMQTYFSDDRFLKIPQEFEHYYKNVERHYRLYLRSQKTWDKILGWIRTKQENH